MPPPRQAIDAAEWRKALHFSQRNAEMAAALYPPGTPALGIQLLRLGKLQARAAPAI